MFHAFGVGSVGSDAGFGGGALAAVALGRIVVSGPIVISSGSGEGEGIPCERVRSVIGLVAVCLSVRTGGPRVLPSRQPAITEHVEQEAGSDHFAVVRCTEPRLRHPDGAGSDRSLWAQRTLNTAWPADFRRSEATLIPGRRQYLWSYCFVAAVGPASAMVSSTCFTIFGCRTAPVWNGTVTRRRPLP